MVAVAKSVFICKDYQIRQEIADAPAFPEIFHDISINQLFYDTIKRREFYLGIMFSNNILIREDLFGKGVVNKGAPLRPQILYSIIAD